MHSFDGALMDPGEVIFIDPYTEETYHVPLMPNNQGERDVSVSHISTYPAKQVMGDWLRSDHDVLSSFVQSDWTGGGQIWNSDEGADLNRFWFGTLGTRHPGQTTLPLRSYYHEADDDPDGLKLAIPMADYGQEFYASFGLDLCTVTDQAAVIKATLDHVPVARKSGVFTGTSGQTRLYIPMGSHGYQHWNGVTLSALLTDVEPIDFQEWDDKLYALQLNGEVYESLTGEGDWQLKFSVPPDSDPRGITVFYDAQNKPTIYVITRKAVYAADLSLGKAYRTKLDPPPHADAGLAVADWREDLYVSYGIGVHQYTGDSIIAMGLDRNDGIPQWLNGRICSMAKGYNGLYCLIQGYQGVEEMLDPSFITDLSWYDFYMSPSSSQPALMMWDGVGWHSVWIPENALRQPTSLYISSQPGHERLWWGIGNRLYWQDVHHMYYNPAQRMPSAEYEEDGWLETSIYDYSMDGQEKIFYALEVMCNSVSSTERIIVEYKIDNDPWVQLPHIDSAPPRDRKVFKIGEKGMFPDHLTPRFDGTPFIDIRFRIRMERGLDSTRTPVLESIASIFHKVMGPLKAYSMVTGLSSEHENREYKGRSMVEITQFLDRMVASRYLVPMGYGGRWRNVRFAGSSGTDQDGVSQSGIRTISVLEVQE